MERGRLRAVSRRFLDRILHDSSGVSRAPCHRDDPTEGRIRGRDYRPGAIGGWHFRVDCVAPNRLALERTELLGKGDLSGRVKPGGSDEIGRLGTSFNAMADRIEDQDAKLRRARDDLEERVRERTAELQASQESLQITLNSIGDAVIATDAEGRIARMNPVAETLTGWSSSDANGKELAEVFRIVNEETRATVESPVDRVLREGIVVGLANHTALIARDGSECAIADSGAPIRDAEGTIRGVVLVFRDQTSDREAERALRESEAQKNAVMEAALDGIVLMNHEGTIVELNPAAEKTFGYTRAEALGKSLATLIIPPSLRKKHTDGLASYLKTVRERFSVTESKSMQSARTAKEFPVEVTVVRINLPGPPVFTGYIRDLTEQKRASEAFEKSEQMLSASLASIQEGVIIGDEGGKLIYQNRAAQVMLGNWTERRPLPNPYVRTGFTSRMASRRGRRSNRSQIAPSMVKRFTTSRHS